MKPKFYSKQAIAVLTVLLSPLLGSILFSYNLREVGKKGMIPAFILGAIFWIYLLRRVTAGFLDNSILQFLFSNALFSLILTLMWDLFFKDYSAYERKKVWKPVAVFTCICLALFAFQVLTSKK